MTHTVYFADKSVIFTPAAPGGEWYAVAAEPDGGISRPKILNFLESHNSVAVVSADPEATFRAFAAQFAWVEAAGGVVVDGLGRWLLIHRNGRWDFPKGHLEVGESIETGAAREVEEETGVRGEVVRPLCRTLHAYWFPKTGRWELKQTHWFELRATEPSALQPQTEEGIERVVWCTPAEAAEYVRGAFPTIRCVAEAMNRQPDSPTAR